MALKETNEGGEVDVVKVAQKVHQNTVSMCIQAGTADAADPQSQMHQWLPNSRRGPGSR